MRINQALGIEMSCFVCDNRYNQSQFHSPIVCQCLLCIFYHSLTVSLSYKNRPPRGAKMIPAASSVGKTVLGVKSGCQALSLCCLNAVSMSSTNVN